MNSINKAPDRSAASRQPHELLPAAIPWWGRILWAVAAATVAAFATVHYHPPRIGGFWVTWHAAIPLAILAAEFAALLVDALLIGKWRRCRDPYLDQPDSWKARAYDWCCEEIAVSGAIADRANVETVVDSVRVRLTRQFDGRFLWYFILAWFTTIFGFLSFTLNVGDRGLVGNDFSQLYLPCSLSIALATLILLLVQLLQYLCQLSLRQWGNDACDKRALSVAAMHATQSLQTPSGPHAADPSIVPGRPRRTVENPGQVFDRAARRQFGAPETEVPDYEARKVADTPAEPHYATPGDPSDLQTEEAIEPPPSRPSTMWDDE